MTSLEIAANLAATVSILLAGRNSVHTWWTGVIGCGLFAALFYEARLYADVTLQLVFIATSFAGWWSWLRGATGAPLPVRHAPAATLGWMALVSVILTLGYGAILHRFTDAYAPFVDSAVLVLSLVAQLLLVRRMVETWAVWLLVDTIAVPLYASRGLNLTAALYAAYWLNALYGGWRWRREMASC
ncbi:nicotinamide riboside transporter PnuC [Sphingomonas alpina]|uniref:Nicotinamide riboside transporter PnuC n=1 Tax=Sphingomonas alpina TaxID=653931 RepID=A0A7H0LFQ9_9SPHN|nr:nicotinamide riboside transporter PnuC [Sphingomonas alpina]QNQ08512.1 nicotinamide mononucleotide transporter [Sphingomonas alpina]